MKIAYLGSKALGLAQQSFTPVHSHIFGIPVSAINGDYVQ